MVYPSEQRTRNVESVILAASAVVVEIPPDTAKKQPAPGEAAGHHTSKQDNTHVPREHKQRAFLDRFTRGNRVKSSPSAGRRHSMLNMSIYLSVYVTKYGHCTVRIWLWTGMF